ncbi:alpha/beta fold hydrolase [Novosphingobium sp. Leaf2]|uniref:alpha/beta fold hydrolase n=1 Tax=Novosphingobium sp. Leaf2 TaxID=1735670 RepID=UPI0007016E1E|nr:alpha/beta hydrolase [Novosphingobium sp. Leaf2]KQM22200.1 hypothetical protein ASE49_02590 [Novosphingobium sp. Leaf2]
MDNRSSNASTPSRDVTRRYVDAGGCVIHYRVAGDGPAVVMLHDSPRSSRLHLATMRALSRRFRVYALDTPGYGNSQPLASSDPTIADFAATLDACLAALGIEGAPIYATHTSAKIALEYAAHRDAAKPRGKVILDGLSIPEQPTDPAFIAAYMRPFVLDDSGGYLAAEWTRMRDMLRWFPWFDRAPSTRMPIAQPSDDWISAYMVDFLSAGPNYACAYAAAMRYDPMPALLRVNAPVTVAARSDDVLYASLDRVPVAANPNLTVERLSADLPAWLAWLENALTAALADAAPAPPLPAQPGTGAHYCDLPHGQMRVHRAGPSSDVPLLVLSAPTTLQALAWQAALPDRATLVPELPGYGESDPLAAPTLENMADAVAAMLQQLGCTHLDLLASGLATALACTLADRHPDAIARIVIDCCPSLTIPGAPDLETLMAPVFPFDPGGGHIHRYWHMLRDQEANWPWFDGSGAAARRIAPSLAARPLHDALVGILKQPARYGDSVRAACRATETAARPNPRQPVLILEDPADVGCSGTEALTAQLAQATIMHRPAHIGETAQIVAQFLAEPARQTETVA